MHHDADVIADLDRCLRQLRRLIIRPPLSSIPIAALGRSVDLAKILACLAIAEHPGEQPTVAELATALNIEHSTTSRLVKTAEVEGLVVRSPDPEDRRRKNVSLTKAGRAVVTEGTATRTWALDYMFTDWDHRDLTALTSLLERLVDTCCTRFDEVRAALPAHFPHPLPDPIPDPVLPPSTDEAAPGE
ncbi:MAG: MarR family transcriptional regulator [Candidatus Nanopelagicales bacterium]|nr:MarR family transcriptional regulator [Candidatus Nanopelagicales bacterium]